jgi:hypothetical protein
MSSIFGFGIIDMDRIGEIRKNGILTTLQKNNTTGCRSCGQL